MISLKNISADPPIGLEKKDLKEETILIAKEIEDLQDILYANKKESLLVIFQGMDSSGKDGCTRETFKYCSPVGVRAHGFKKPTDDEFAHDFLWRVHKLVPAQGMIHVFNRSHYEDILIQRVHKWIDMDRVEQRMRHINNFERLLEEENKTIVLKFYLHLSPERQLEKLQERKDLLRKNYKHNDGDWEERKHWDKYMEAYEYAINESDIPWNIIPADARWYRNYAVATQVRDVLKELNQKYPALEK